MPAKEYEIQKALGLADAYDLTISLYPNIQDPIPIYAKSFILVPSNVVISIPFACW